MYLFHNLYSTIKYLKIFFCVSCFPNYSIWIKYRQICICAYFDEGVNMVKQKPGHPFFLEFMGLS